MAAAVRPVPGGKTADPSPYGLMPSFEAACSLHACNNPEWFPMFGDVFDPQLLNDWKAREVVGAAHDHWREHGCAPGGRIVIVQRLRRKADAGKISVEKIHEINDWLDETEDTNPPPLEVCALEIAPIVRDRVTRHAMQTGIEAVAAHDSAKVDAASALLGLLPSIGRSRGGESLRAGAAALERIVAAGRAHRLPTGCDELDTYLAGGLRKGCIGVVAAETGVGKSQFCTSVCASAALSGLTALYATNELPVETVMARHVSNVTGIPVDDVLDGKYDRKPVVEALDATAGRFETEWFEPGSATLDDVWAWVERIVADERDADRHSAGVVLVMDYIDRFRPRKRRDRADKWELIGEMFGEVYSRAQREGWWIWSPSQLKNKNARKHSKAHVDDLAGSSEKQRAVDLVLMAARDESVPGSLHIEVLKNRYGNSEGPPVEGLRSDLARARLFPVARTDLPHETLVPVPDPGGGW